MPKVLRLAVLACAAATSLAFAGSALAKPKLIISAAGTGVGIQFEQARTDDAPARLVIYVPDGYAANPVAASGTTLGTLHADLLALQISPDAVVPVEGQIVAGNPAQFATNQCAPGPHTAVWLLHVTVTGRTLDVPAYVDSPIPAGDPLAGKSSSRITICFSSPYVPEAMGGAPFGVKVSNAELTLNQGVLAPPAGAGSFVWRVVMTPYTVGTGTPNVAGTVEARALVDQPNRLSIDVRINKKPRAATITGTLMVGRFVLSGVTVKLVGSARAAKRTNNAGRAVFSVRLKKKRTYRFRLTASHAAYDVTSEECKARTAPTLPCVTATAAAFAVTSRTITVKVR